MFGMASVDGLSGVDELGFREGFTVGCAATLCDGERIVLAVVRDLPRLFDEVKHDGNRVRVVDLLWALSSKDFLDGASKEDGEALTGKSCSVTFGGEDSAKFDTDSKRCFAVGFFRFAKVCAVLVFLFEKRFEYIWLIHIGCLFYGSFRTRAN
jgi:hypothetical protein